MAARPTTPSVGNGNGNGNGDPYNSIHIAMSTSTANGSEKKVNGGFMKSMKNLFVRFRPEVILSQLGREEKHVLDTLETAVFLPINLHALTIIFI
jgi:hypothetical protein